MSVANLDFAELYVTVKDYFTRKPYVDPFGHTTEALPYEQCVYTDTMYEPKNHQLGQAQITLPTLIGREQWRPLYQQIKEGARVEIYNFQPDCGDPVFAGYIPPNGITEQNGMVQILVNDALEQGNWQRLQNIEEGDMPLDDWYTRALSHWTDIANEDFSNPDASRYNVALAGGLFGHMPVTTFKQGALRVTPAAFDDNQDYDCQIKAVTGVDSFTPAPGETYLFEVVATFFIDGHLDGAVGYNPLCKSGIEFGLTDPAHDFLDLVAAPVCQFKMARHYNNVSTSPAAAYKWLLGYQSAAAHDQDDTPLSRRDYGGALQGPALFNRDFSTEPFPVTHRMSMMLRFGRDSMVQTVALDGQVLNSAGGEWSYENNTPVVPVIDARVSGRNSYVDILRFRLRKLTPYVYKAGHFTPQTTDTVAFLPNQETGVSFFEFLAENDNAEFRVLYRANEDEVELDGVGTLGRDASQQLDYFEAPTPIPPSAPGPGGTEVGFFLDTPPFRFEEGHNMASVPSRETRQIAHANELTKLGVGQGSSQLQSTAWSEEEVGNPAAGVAPTYPHFEAVSNDNRAAVQAIVDDLAVLELARAIDPTPSLSFEVLEEVTHAGRWRAGDSIWTKTQSLIDNVEESMRVMQVQVTAGSAQRAVIMGRKSFDATLQRLLAKDMVMDWLYEQNSEFGTALIYPMVPTVLNPADTSPLFMMPLDQFNSGKAIISASLRWFTDGVDGSPVSEVTASVNGTSIFTEASGTDSGNIDVSGIVGRTSLFNLLFQNNGASTHTLISAFLTVRLRI